MSAGPLNLYASSQGREGSSKGVPAALNWATYRQEIIAGLTIASVAAVVVLDDVLTDHLLLTEVGIVDGTITQCRVSVGPNFVYPDNLDEVTYKILFNVVLSDGTGPEPAALEVVVSYP